MYLGVTLAMRLKGRLFKWTNQKQLHPKFCWYVFIDQHFLFSLNTVAKKYSKISMLEFRNQSHLIHKFFKTLSRGSRQSFHCYFMSIMQFSLAKKRKRNRKRNEHILVWFEEGLMNLTDQALPYRLDQSHLAQAYLLHESCLL